MVIIGVAARHHEADHHRDNKDGHSIDLVAQVTLSGVQANPADLYPAPITIGAAEADVRVTLDPFRVTIGRAQISDNGQTLLVEGEVAAEPEGWHLALDGQMDSLAPDRLLTLWPSAAAPNTRR